MGAAKHKYAASHRQGGDGKNPVPLSKSEAILRASNYYPSALSRAHFQKIMQGKFFSFLFFLPSPEQTPALGPWAQLLACSRPSAPNMGSRLSPGQRNTAMHKIHLRCNGEQTASAACVGSLLCVRNPATSHQLNLRTSSGGFSVSHQGCGCCSALSAVIQIRVGN